MKRNTKINKANKIKQIKPVVDWPYRNRICFFCMSDKSVKYDATLVNGKTVPCCNKCAFLYYVVGE